jgi:transposase
MKKARRKFSKEFKISVLRELQSGKTHAELCRKYDIHPSLLGKWKTQFDKDPKSAFSGNGKPSSQDAKIAELERIVGQLYAENAFLKKTLSNLESRLQDYRKRAGLR